MGSYVGVTNSANNTKEFALTYVEKVPEDTIQSARIQVCDYAQDPELATELLSALGLIGEADEYLSPTTMTAAERKGFRK